MTRFFIETMCKMVPSQCSTVVLTLL